MPLKELLKYNKDCIQRLDSRPHSQDILNVGFWILQGSRVHVRGAVQGSRVLYGEQSPNPLRLKAELVICVFVGMALRSSPTLYLRVPETSKMVTANRVRPINMKTALEQETVSPLARETYCQDSSILAVQ